MKKNVRIVAVIIAVVLMTAMVWLYGFGKLNFVGFASIEFERWQWLGIIAVALMVGMAKAGLSATVMLAVPLLATIISGKGSTGMMVSMFIVGDVFAVLFYKQNVNWTILKNLALWVIVGVLLGTVVGGYVPAEQFTYLVSGSVLICLILLVYMEVKKDTIHVPETMWFYALTGIACGLTSMIGNMAGPIFAVYLLAKRLDKKNYMGTVAVFFFMMNLIKLPLQIFFWHNITKDIMAGVVLMIPIILIGAFIGKYLIRIMNERVFKNVILIMTAITSIKLFF